MTFLKRTASCALPALMVAIVGLVAPRQALADSNPFIGEIAPMSIINFCPEGWSSAEGQFLQIADNDALYALIGTTFGGDGVNTFALPDLRSRFPMGQAAGPGVTPRTWGEMGGQEATSLTVAQMAPHSHLVNATNSDGNFPGPADRILGAAPPSGVGQETIYSNQPANVVMSPEMIGPTGGSTPMSVQDPTLVIRYCIALEGIFPSRS